MYEITDEFKGKAIVAHMMSGDFDYTDAGSIEEAVKEQVSEWWKEGGELTYAEAIKEARQNFAEYTTEEQVLHDADAGYGWPIMLGFVDILDDAA